jgi:hypothetical protein
MNKLLSLALSLVALNACTAETAQEEQPVASNESALINTGGGGGLSYSCEGLLCTCTGDVDCNDMFSDGICGPIASCDDTTYPPTCKCLKLGARSVGTVKTSATTTTTKAIAP